MLVPFSKYYCKAPPTFTDSKMLVKGDFSKLLRTELRKEFLSAYKNYDIKVYCGLNIPYTEPIMPRIEAETAYVDEVKEDSNAIKLIQEHLKPMYYQQRVFQSLKEFINLYEEYVDDLTTTQKRLITRILNKLHED